MTKKLKISIHALVKRATERPHTFGDYGCDFNPRPREEGDKCKRDSYKIKIYFNPRPREEGDRQRRLDLQQLNISIHALVKRATVEPA